MKTLLLGWGNPDRQDDGAAWHVLAEVARRSGLSVPEDVGESFEFPDHAGELDLIFQLQLTPEMSETIAQYDRVVFVDAHTGSVDNDLNIREVSPYFQTSPLTHHLTAESCLEMATQLYHVTPQAWLVSIRGYKFGFSNEMSEQTQLLVQKAADHIVDWLRSNRFDAP